MTDKVIATCESCGARLEASSKRCELCGWIVGSEDHDMQEAKAQEKRTGNIDDSNGSGVEGSDTKGPYCHMCGWKNPEKAVFCSSCGTRLQKVNRPDVKKADLPAEHTVKAPVKSAEEYRASEGVSDSTPVKGLQVGMLIIASFLVVGVLYMITAFSKRAFPAGEAGAPQQAEAASSAVEVAPLSGDLARRIDVMTAEAESLEGDARTAKQKEIVNTLLAAQRFDRAAPVQEEVARARGTAAEWFQTGHLYYDWMDQLSGEQRLDVAQRAVSAYEQGLALDSTDLNVRTALAMAYLNTRTPMLGVQQIRQVLDEDPDHLQGNFYFGVMLMQINRLDQAEAQFERVKEMVGEENPIYQQADMMLQNLRSLRQSG